MVSPSETEKLKPLPVLGVLVQTVARLDVVEFAGGQQRE
jgi:hypothetical protein